jgi:hypothetical protein
MLNKGKKDVTPKWSNWRTNSIVRVENFVDTCLEGTKNKLIEEKSHVRLHGFRFIWMIHLQSVERYPSFVL